jgi:PTS system ascorbate-specific IIA component
MSVGILIVAHGKLGHLLAETMTEMLGPLPLTTEVLEVRRGVQVTDALLRQGERAMERLDTGDGVLLLTDAYGSTPSNIANRLASSPRMQVVAGINLPMLVRIYNYPALDLAAMAQNAVEGGQRGIVMCPRSVTAGNAVKE